ncbi:MAG TPA: sigma-70 family RNA polymerase sigma factor [Steroidobacteraceae bacterium]|jgi:RNA polymerase sigma-70 factor (ECF subfamily)|nr:sigma-70 family RNA polymerase sigma factor [Steroidobacteraceae bacterium]
MRALFGHNKVTVHADDAQLLALLTQIQAGSISALSQLYSATVGKVYGLTLRITANRADAEEVTCDVYQQVWRAASQFDPKRGSLSQWILVIARNRALDCYRRRRPHTAAQWAGGQPPPQDDIPTAEEMVQQFEVGTRVRAAISSLSAVQARLIGLAFFEGLTHREIAARTQLPLGTVKSHLCRALTVLRRTLAGSDIPEPSRAESCVTADRREAPITALDVPQYQLPPT